MGSSRCRSPGPGAERGTELVVGRSCRRVCAGLLRGPGGPRDLHRRSLAWAGAARACLVDQGTGSRSQIRIEAMSTVPWSLAMSGFIGADHALCEARPGSQFYLRDARIAAPAARCRDPSEFNVGAHGNDAALWQAEEIYRALRRA